MVKEILSKADEKMKKSITVLKSDLASLKAGRANPTMLDRIEVEYYGSMMPINQVANVSAPEPRILTIAPWEKSTLKAIEKAILKSDLGINPSNDGTIIRLVVPELTEDFDVSAAAVDYLLGLINQINREGVYWTILD